MGWQGPGNTEAFLASPDCQVVAACDIDANHLQAAVKKINDAYGNEDCKGYHDYRELLARDDIDAVMIAVPDHWHEIVATEAARRKKDIYGEKPLAHTIAEQQSIVRAVQENKIIWQMGSWQRSVPMFHKAAEIVRNGLIGDGDPCRSRPAGRQRGFRRRRARRHWQSLACQGAKRGQPGADCVRARRPGICWSPILPRNWTTRCGSAHRRWSRTSGLAPTNPGAGTTTPAAANFWTGSAIIATLRTGASISINTGPLEVEGSGELPPRQRGVEHRAEVPVRIEVSARRHHDDCRRLSRHQDGREVDWHRRLGMGRSRRI